MRAALASVLESFPEVYLALDALDECTEREDLMEFLDELLSSNIRGLHLLATSRQERDIEIGLCDHQPVQVGLEEEQVNGDIKLHIASKLSGDPRLKRLAEPIKIEIEAALLNGAKGMYVSYHFAAMNLTRDWAIPPGPILPIPLVHIFAQVFVGSQTARCLTTMHEASRNQTSVGVSAKGS